MEERLQAGADGLATVKASIERPASERFDAQQRRAYGYAMSDDARLKVITGVPGADKTTLISEIVAAYANAGCAVRAVSVANSAVDVLRRETIVPAQSVAKELYEWAQERGQLGKRDVLIIDEVSTLGTKQGGELLSHADKQGASVIVLGDDKQFQAVAHGSALTMMQRAVGTQAVDLTKTRRQSEAWQREATEAVRRGEVRSALDAYKTRGFVQEHATQDDARAALVARWVHIERSGVECGIEAFTNRERMAVNTLAREEWRAMGRLRGEDVSLETVDGPTPYAIGDRVVIRETLREAGLFNGSVGTVRGIADETLMIERRDGKVVPVDTRAHPGVQHAYCSTEYREQGSTRYAELQLVTQHVNQRSLTVGMTRHTDEYGMYYSREAVGAYDDLVKLGLRTQSKELASDYAVVQREVSKQTRSMSVRELRSELEPIAKRKDGGYSLDERKAAFRLLNGLEALPPDAQLQISKELRQELREPRKLQAQIQQQVKAQVHSRERDRGRGLER